MRFQDLLNLLKEDDDKKVLEEIINKANYLTSELLNNSDGLSLAKKITECGFIPSNTLSGRLIQVKKCIKSLHLIYYY